MKMRIEGRVVGGRYKVHDADGGVLTDVTLDEARADSRLAAAIKRNGWEAIPNE